MNLRKHVADVTLFVAVSFWAVAAIGQDKEFSGPQPGEMLSPFKVVQVLSPEKDEQVEIATPKEETVVLMFMHKLSEPAIGLMISIEWYAAKHKSVHGHFIMLHEDQTKALQLARRWAARPFFSKAPMSVSVDGLEGPGKYGLNRNMDMTVIVARKNRVVHNFAINAPNNTDAPGILKAVASVIGKPAPSYERIRTELRAERDKRRERRLRENAVFKLAPNVELGRLMTALANSERATEAAAKEISVAMVKWAGDDENKKKLLFDYVNKVRKGSFKLNRYAREALEKLAEE